MSPEEEAREAYDRAALAARLIRDEFGTDVDAAGPLLLNRLQLEALLDRAWTMGATVVERLTLGDRTCRICGCTETRACPGRCCWVAEDLCSSCAMPGAAAAAEACRRCGRSGAHVLACLEC